MKETHMILAEQAVSVVRELVKRESENPGSDEYKVSCYIKEFCKNLGMEVVEVPVSERRVNLVCRYSGSGKAAPIAFTGHMDVVPVSEAEKNKWKVGPYAAEILNGRLYGRGAADMKGGLGAVLAALQQLKQNSITPPGDVVLIATVDEEAVMLGAKKIVETPYLNGIKNLVICEPSDMLLGCSCRGRTWADVSVWGQSAHASIEGAGNNAIMQAVRLLQALNPAQKRVPFKPHPHVGNFFWQCTVVQGGIEPAIIPDKCVVTVDARPVPGQHCSEIWDVFNQLLDELHQADSSFNATCQVIESREPWETPEQHPLVRLAGQALTASGAEVKPGGASYTTDGAVFTRLGMDMIILGPGSIQHAHRDNEYVEVRQLQQAAQAYYEIMAQNNLPL